MGPTHESVNLTFVYAAHQDDAFFSLNKSHSELENREKSLCTQQNQSVGYVTFEIRIHRKGE